jgi:hypothetical protein
MVHKYAVFPQIQATVIAYVQGERTFYDAQFVLEAQLQDLLDEIAREMRDEFGVISLQEISDEEARRKRSVYAQLLIGAERHAREGGISLGPKKVTKLLRLLCWMCDTANELGKYRSPPPAAEAA